MTTTLTLLGTYVLFALWQSTLWLTAAWTLGKLYRREPWKAHSLYVLGILAATLTPLLSTIVSATGGGMLTIAVPQWIEPALYKPEWAGMFCLIGATLFTALLLYGIASSRWLMFHAVPFPDRESQDVLLRHSKTLRNVSLPILFTSPSVKSPTVWCWGLHPAVLLPESLADKLGNTERDAVFLHELSHIIRRDHLTTLFTRLCGALLFWNPLYWLVLWQSDLSADESCDHVVLAQGNIPPEQYTDTLLRLVAGERTRPFLQPFSRKEKIMKRIEQIQSPLRKQGSPAASRLWTASVFLTALLVCATLSCFQERNPSSSDKAVITAPFGCTHMIIFGPADNFMPKNPEDYLNLFVSRFDEFGVVQAACFRTKVEDGKLMAYNLTGNPAEFKRMIEAIPQFKYIDTVRLTQESFEAYEKTVQESLPPADGGFVTPESVFTHMIIFGPADDFMPKNPADYLNLFVTRFDEFGVVQAGYFRTKVEDGKLMAYNLTGNPAEFKRMIEAIPQFKYIGTERLTQEMFEAYEKTAQESLPPADGGFVSPNGNLTHLVVCGPAGDFEPSNFPAYYDLCNQPFVSSGATWMFAKIRMVDGKNQLLSLTDDPEKLRKAIESLPQLEYLRTERLTKEMFEEHIKPWVGRQVTAEGLPNNSGQ